MLMSRTLWVPVAAAAVLVGVLLSAPAFAQAHIRGTLTAAKDGTISVQTVKGGTESIKLANDAEHDDQRQYRQGRRGRNGPCAQAQLLRRRTDDHHPDERGGRRL